MGSAKFTYILKMEILPIKNPKTLIKKTSIEPMAQ